MSFRVAIILWKLRLLTLLSSVYIMSDILKQEFDRLKDRYDNFESLIAGHTVLTGGIHPSTEVAHVGASVVALVDTPVKDLQSQVKSLSDSLRSFVLPPELKLNHTRGHAGIRKQDQDTAKIISKCADFNLGEFNWACCPSTRRT